MMNSLPKQKTPVPDRFPGNLYQKFKEEVILIVYNLFEKIETEEMFPNSSYEANSALIPKPQTL